MCVVVGGQTSSSRVVRIPLERSVDTVSHSIKQYVDVSSGQLLVDDSSHRKAISLGDEGIVVELVDLLVSIDRLH